MHRGKRLKITHFDDTNNGRIIVAIKDFDGISINSVVLTILEKSAARAIVVITVVVTDIAETENNSALKDRPTTLPLQCFHKIYRLSTPIPIVKASQIFVALQRKLKNMTF